MVTIFSLARQSRVILTWAALLFASFSQGLLVVMILGYEGISFNIKIIEI